MTSGNVRVAVLGLGEMGSALAGAFLDGGHPTTVWNRTPGKGEGLVAKGAKLGSTVREAVGEADVVVVNVKGASVAEDVLGQAGDALAGRAVVDLTDGTSAEVRRVAERAAGAGYLHGQIMTIAPGIGHPDATIFYAGAEAVYERHLAALGLLSGHAPLVSGDPGVAVLYGMAVHGTMWGLLNGFLHGAAALADEGVRLEDFLERAEPALSALSGFLPVIAGEVDRGEHATPYGALRHHLPSIEDLVRESRARGIDTELPEYTLGLVAEAVGRGYGDDSYSRLVEHFRRSI
ncbi:NAD(P)-dependent oxidoreductase [Actinomadura madurae]|uniref:NAD(P)-dependent oxidoreductase n=1 Tax=Actinomadura madurae TaxID=1993 RepID=UPI002026B2C1|nr:NAD(P)-binding domain-containing protein [Actinomadura madurae]MCP9949149.1 NAD(P)-binding domain-containing protein [Actinomadura madurae]MCP9965918.1 NAD(P)-binding domain-containing protein [Actinomadura madurae]MCP9978392.1 NAD(P)-binding domain-containing protein [Actinomadura madurae]MCQ0010086.1 NAD(P)-binding domain-containing protein [Actinomadura madurae]MCQ0014599.1 NAD(P)-binding domain-containing protein [Actinomadura madurae]